jgi:hypothetical protein
MVGDNGKRLAGGVEPAVGLAGKLDMQPPVIAAGGEKREQRGKVDVAGPEGKVVVAAGEHVVDMDVDDEADERGEGRGQRPLPHAFQMPEIDGEPQALRGAEPVAEHAEASERVDHHPRLRLEAEAHAALRRPLDHGPEACAEPVEVGRVVGRVAPHARPEGEAGSTHLESQFGGEIDRGEEEVDTSPAGGRIGGNERRLVLVEGIEEMAPDSTVQAMCVRVRSVRQRSISPERPARLPVATAANSP